jgi:DNA-binding GntR family transcriptional regulator
MTTPVFKTKKDLIAEILREAILNCELKPGERLHQNELASRFDISSTPVREALRQLEAEGVLIYNPHKGVHVAEIKREYIREVYLIRGALEGLATEQAVFNINHEEHILKLRSLHSSIETFVTDNQIEKMRKANYEFHMLIYQAAKMPLLIQMIQRLWTVFPWDSLYVLPTRARESVVEHLLIIEAIEKRKPKLAHKYMTEHLDKAASTILAYLPKEGD